jgi:hypothetical protein
MRILGPIVVRSPAFMAALDPQIAGAAPYDRKSSVTIRSGTKAYFFSSFRINFRAACLLRLD